MTDNKSRASFEAYITKHFGFDLSKTINGFYVARETNMSWHMWCESASFPLTVILPKKRPILGFSHPDESEDHKWAFNGALDEIRALNADKSIVWVEKE